MDRFLLAPLGVLLLLVAVACSSSGGGGSPATNSAVCSDVASLKSSVAQLKTLDLSSNSIDQVKAKLTAVGNDLQQVATTAKGQYSKQVDAIQHDYASLKSAVQIAVKNPTYPTIAQVRTSFSTLVSAVTHFANSIAATC